MYRTVVVSVILLTFTVAGWLSLRGDSATTDETPHIAAGYTYLDRGDFRMNPEHPPLAKMWAALPLWLRGAAEPDYGSEAWRQGKEWDFGFEVLNGPVDAPVRRDPDRLLHPARAMILALGILLCLVVFRWASGLWGVEGGTLALLLCALSPPVLAHARLVTTDLPAALGFTVCLWTFGRWLAAPSWKRLVLTGLALGGSLLVKFTSLLLLPMLGLAALGWSLRTRRLAPLAGLAAVGLLGWAVLWAGYGFRYAPSPDPGYAMPWATLERNEGPTPAPVELAARLHLAPESYLFGITYAIHDETRLGYLNGVESVSGWRLYFPIAFAIKTPPAFLLLALWGIAECLRARGRSRRRETVLLILVPLALYAVFSIRSRLDIGHRHLLPMYPLLCVAAGSLAQRAREVRVAAWVLCLAIVGAAVSFGFATPGYLSYFNVLGGGARGGWRHLLDSNLDWGQDLKRLAAWQRAHGGPPLHLAYFGTADPRAYGLAYRKVFTVPDLRPREPAVQPASGDLLAVSLNLREGLFLERDRELARAVYNRRWMDVPTIRRYTSMQLARIRAAEPYPTFAEWAVAEGLLTPAQVREAAEDLLSTFFARLRDTQQPVGWAGDSIVIYRVP